MQMTFIRRAATAFLAAVFVASSVPEQSAAESVLPMEPAADTESSQELSRVSVHDPSVIKADGTYYLFGTHLADAKSTDLIRWTQMNPDWNARGDDSWKQDSVYGEVLENLSESFAWAGYNDGDTANGGLGVWAPDVTYNPYYLWEDGSKGAYMLYYSASSTWKRSCIGYAVSKVVEGPYQHIDTIIYSGFTKTGEVDHGLGGPFSHSDRNTKWDNRYLNLSELIEAGSLSGISDNWFTSTGGWREVYAPNAIDPTVFFDKHDNMYMVYGSWSGGLFIHELEKTTGAVKYPGEDSTESVSGNFTDRYFGTHIAGGNHQSGEGAYILYDAETDYYYLYETYGGLLSGGGYNMRLFRSKHVYGPYLDAMGNNAKDSGRDNEKYGIKLIGNYAFLDQPGYRAAGHCSALIDEDGQRYLFYHQRFDLPENQHEGHQIRVRKQYMNEDQWPVPSVYEYLGETAGHYDREDVVGSYELIDHGTLTNGDMIGSQKLELYADGTTGGARLGTWEMSAGEGKDYDYITLRFDGVVYKGVLSRQRNEETPSKEVLTFSAIGNNNTCLWGSGEKEIAAKPEPDPDPTPDPDTGTKPTPAPDSGTSTNPAEKEDSVPVQKSLQEISVKAEFKKTYGCKAFSLNAKLKQGDGVLSYVSRQPSIASIDKTTGTVTIKGTGIAKIVITASETKACQKAAKIVTIKAAPQKVTFTEVKSKAAKKAVLKWKKVKKASGYQIQYAANARFRSSRISSVPKGSAKSTVISRLKRKKTWYFRVRAYKKSGNTLVYGAYSKVRKVKVK